MFSGKIVFKKPANEWCEASLLGNGHTGCAIYGGVFSEQVDLSENTFYSGAPSKANNRETAKQSFYEMRKLIQNGNYKGSAEVAKNFMGNRENYGTNLPVGRLMIDFLSDNQIFSNYRRELDISGGITKISYQSGSASYTRECFVSHPEKVLVYSIKAEPESKISCRIRYSSSGLPSQTFAGDDLYFFQTQAFEAKHSDNKTGVRLIGRISVETLGGSKTITNDFVEISSASEIYISLEMTTDFECELSSGSTNDSQNDFADTKMISLLPGIVKKVSAQNYEKLKAKHMADVLKFMSRVELSLDGYDNKTEQMFQFGRYLLLSSSREDSKLPAHLQGIWNDEVACNIGWSCDMHLDINTQMNYWFTEPANLTECHTPLFNWIESRLIPSGRITALESYGLEGWVAELVSNAWGYSAPYWARSLSPCPTGGIWIASDYFERYLYTGDIEFLKKRAYPVLAEATVFFSNYVFEENGYYSSGPSISPENAYLAGEEKFYFSNGCTYEILMIRELFDEFLKASKILDIQNELTEKVTKILPKLLAYRVLRDGTLAEWNHDYPSADFQHRHTSHLLGLFPYSQITLEKTPKLAAACKKSVENKLIPYENWEDTGWARSMLMLYSARLNDGEAALFHIKEMQEKLTHESLLVMHPPTRGAASFKEVYELDGNTGFSMCVIEMLMQSHDDEIRLLPTLPLKWQSGHLKGIVARGGIKLNIHWKNSVPEKVEILSQSGRDIPPITFKGKPINRELLRVL